MHAFISHHGRKELSGSRGIGPVILLTLILCALFLLLAWIDAVADTATLSASKDNTLFQPAAGNLSNGAGDFIFTGVTNSSNLVRRGLLAFDLSGIPAGSTVTSATLTLYLSRGRSGTRNVSLHRSLAAWGEGTSNATGEEGGGIAAAAGDATWLHRSYPTTLWTTAGGDYAALASATTGIAGNGFYSWTGTGLRDDVQAWLNSPGTNNGWLLKGDESTNRTARRFDSRTNPDPTHRPKLVVVYTTAVPAGACCLPSDACTTVTATECALLAGTYQGDGTSCSPNPCFVPVGACCHEDGTCTEESAADCAAAGGTYRGDGTDCAGVDCPVTLTPYVDALPRPAVASPTSGLPGDVASYTIPILEIEQKLHRDLPFTTLWGYGGSYPGPTIEAGRNKPITVNWINDLRDSTGALRTTHFLPVDLCPHGPDSTGPTPRTVVHLHGGHVPMAVDGYPEWTFLPGESDTYVYPNNQAPATLWYHDHAMGITRLNVMMGLAGFYLLRDDYEQALGLPSGEYEIAMAIQDRSVRSDGSLVYPEIWMDHFFGDKILVNGKIWPYLNVKRGKYRFRLLNGSNSRVYHLALSNGLPITVIGTDDGLLTAPVVVNSLLLTPGERADVVIDFDSVSPGTEIILTNDAPAPYPGSPGVGVIPNVMKFIVDSTHGFVNPLPAALRPVVAIDPASAARTRDFELAMMSDPCAGSMWTINGMHWHDLTERPVLGTAEIWRFINRSGTVHPMHMHLVAFQVLDRQNFIVQGDSIVTIGSPVPPAPSEMGWKDTAPVAPGEVLRVIARFEDYTGRYPYHCHILEHEDHDMMRQFEVVESPSDVPDGGVPVMFRLSDARPNPFQATTTIAYHLSRPGPVDMRVFDVAGREVRTLVRGTVSELENTVTWDGADDLGRSVPSGLYLIHVAVGDQRISRKVVVVR